MKKLTTLLLTLILCFSLTGCGEKEESDNQETNNKPNTNQPSTLSCVKTNTNEEGYTTTDTINITYKDNTIQKIENINAAEMKPEELESSYSLRNRIAESFHDINGFEMAYSKESGDTLIMTITVDYDKLDIDALTEKLGEASNQNTFYTSKEVDLEKFKTAYLEDYMCK